MFEKRHDITFERARFFHGALHRRRLANRYGYWDYLSHSDQLTYADLYDRIEAAKSRLERTNLLISFVKEEGYRCQKEDAKERITDIIDNWEYETKRTK